MSANLQRRTARESGMTLVEIMVAMLVLAISTTVILGILIVGAKGFASQSFISETQMTARFGVGVIAQDLAAAGYGATPHCESDLSVLDDLNSCTPFDDGATIRMQGIVFVDDAARSYGPGEAYNPQFQPDEIWIATNPNPSMRILASASGTAFSVTTGDAATSAKAGYVLGYPVVRVDQRGTVSFRTPSDIVPGDATTPWTFTLSPELPAETGAGAVTVVSAVAWYHYYIRPEPTNPLRLQLVRDTHKMMGQPVFSSDVIAEDVVDLQLSFCRDEAFVIGTPGASNVQCELSDAAVVNANPAQLRSVTVTIRVRDGLEDSDFSPDPATPLGWYDVDGNPDNGAARVRTTTRTVAMPNMVVN